LRLKTLEKLKTASLISEFTGSDKKSVVKVRVDVGGNTFIYAYGPTPIRPNGPDP